MNQTKPADGGTVVRSVTLAGGAALLILMGQWVTALVAGAAYVVSNYLAALRKTGWRQGEIAPGLQVSSRQASDTPADNRRRSASDQSLEVEKRPRQDTGQPPKGSKKGNTQEDLKKRYSGIMGRYNRFMDNHPKLRDFITKLGTDNIGMLAAFVSWSILTSIVPIIVGLVALSSLFFRDPHSQAVVISHLSNATQHAFSAKEIKAIVKGSAQHSGILGLIGFVGVLWGGANVGGSLSTAFQAIFEVQGRSFIKEKLIDVGMVFVFTILMIVIIAGSSAAPILTGMLNHVPVPFLTWLVGILIDVVAAFLLFGAIYLVLPNIKPAFRFGNVWRGALLSSILFTILSQVWNVYASFQHFGKYGVLLSSLLIFTAWIYFFSMITMVGAEIVAFEAIEEAKREGKSVGPQPKESVPQHEVLRNEPVAR